MKPAFHRFRAVGGRVVAVDETRRFAVLSREEHDAYLRGKAGAAADLFSSEGFGSVDAQGAAASSLAGWRGPRRMSLLLARMPASVARAALDLAFSSPSPGLVVELACRSVEDVWPVLRFSVEYAQRRAEWGKRRLSLVARATERAQSERIEWLAARGVERRTILSINGAPKRGELPAFSAQTAEAVVDAAPETAAAWVDWLSEAGLRSVRFAPSAPAKLSRFLDFYSRALARVAELEGPLLDESVRALLAEPRWALPGLDVLEELCCAADGTVYTSERAALLPEGARGLFALGTAGELRLPDLASHPAVRAALAAAEPENQPACGACAYAPFCAIPISASYAEQGTTWGRMPDSFSCALNMGRLDAVFGIKEVNKFHDLLAKHGC